VADCGNEVHTVVHKESDVTSVLCQMHLVAGD
jgi:hypothetical protein